MPFFGDQLVDLLLEKTDAIAAEASHVLLNWTGKVTPSVVATVTSDTLGELMSM